MTSLRNRTASGSYGQIDPLCTPKGKRESRQPWRYSGYFAFRERRTRSRFRKESWHRKFQSHPDSYPAPHSECRHMCSPVRTKPEESRRGHNFHPDRYSSPHSGGQQEDRH